MKAIILAAGKAPRLLPLTKDKPQCLLEVKGKPILQWQVETLREAGVKDIIVICGYLAGKVEKACEKLKVKSLLNPFYSVSGMAMTMWVAKQELEKGFLLIYSDILFDSKTVSEMLKQKENICLAIKKDGVREEAEKVVEKNGIVKKITKERIPEENGEFIGMIKVSEKGAKEMIKELNKMAKQSLTSSLIEIIEKSIENGEKVAAFDIKESRFVDIDFPEDLEKAEKTMGE